MGASRGAHCGASIVAHFACKVRGTNLWRIMQRIQLSPHFHLRAPHFASKVSYSASPQRATMLAPQRATMLRRRVRPCSAFFQQKKGIPKPPPRWRFRDTLRYLSDVAYSSPAKRGSHAGRSVGFCSKSFNVAAGTKRFSTTRRNMYSSNHSSVMMRWP